MTDALITDTVTEPAVVEPSGPPKASSAGGAIGWMKENLFSSVGNTILTIAATLVSLFTLRFFITLVFQEETNWLAVGTNIRLLTTFTYPADEYWRVWLILGILFATAGITLPAFGARPSVTLRKLSTFFASLGALIVVGSLLGAWANVLETRSVFGSIIVGVLIFLPAFAMFRKRNADEIIVPFEAMLIGTALFFLALLWLVPWGRHELVDGEIINLPGTINISTKLPWTIVIAVGVLSYFVAKALRNVIPERPWRALMSVWWVVGPALLVFYIWRGPIFDLGYVLRVDIPMALAFAGIGGGILYYLTNPKHRDRGRLIAAGLLMLALSTFFFALLGFNWVEAIGGPAWAQTLFGLWPMLQKARISLLLLALFAFAAPTFAGEGRARRRYVTIWTVSYTHLTLPTTPYV